MLYSFNKKKLNNWIVTELHLPQTSLVRQNSLTTHKKYTKRGFDNKFIITTVFLLVLVYSCVEKKLNFML